MRITSNIFLTVAFLCSLAFPHKTQGAELYNTYELIEAVKANDTTKLEYILHRDVDINSFYNGMTALHVACLEGTPEMVKELLVNGADPNLPRQKIGDTPIMLALNNPGNVPQILTALVDHGADINARTEGGSTVLYYAVGLYGMRPDALPIIKRLLSMGADPNGLAEVAERTPLFLAITSLNPDPVNMLLEYGADPNIPTKQGKTMLARIKNKKYRGKSAQSRQLAIINMLMEHDAKMEIQEDDRKIIGF